MLASRFKRKPGTDECDVGIFEYVSPTAGGIGGELNHLVAVTTGLYVCGSIRCDVHSGSQGV